MNTRIYALAWSILAFVNAVPQGTMLGIVLVELWRSVQ